MYLFQVGVSTCHSVLSLNSKMSTIYSQYSVLLFYTGKDTDGQATSDIEEDKNKKKIGRKKKKNNKVFKLKQSKMKNYTGSYTYPISG